MRNIRTRIESLEARFAKRRDELILSFADGTTSPMYASSKRFMRMANSLMGNQPNVEHQIWDHDSVEDMKRAVKLEGQNSELFYLLRALALGPAEDNTPMTVPIGESK